MSAMQAGSMQVDGLATRVLRGGPDRCAALPLVFVHGGAPGLTPYCSGAHIWGAVLERFAGRHPVFAPDLPGSGGTALPAGEGLGVDDLAAHLRATLRALGIARCHFIGHDLGGLIALNLAAAEPDLAASVTTVASVAAAPTGDSPENLVLAWPPSPAWGRASQAWALEQVSFSRHHIDAALLDACEAAAAGAAHAEAASRMARGARDASFVPSLMKAKSQLFETTRAAGIAVPVQVLWGSHDPLGTLEQGMWQFRAVAQRQDAAQFHVINRAGALPFREEPEAFYGMVEAFCEGITAR